MHIILIILPLLFQIIFGRKAIGGDIKLSFGTVCVISFLSQIIFTILAFNIIVYYLEKNNNACGMPLVGLTMFSLLLTLILFITIIIQYRIKKSYGDDEIEEIDEIEDENDKIEDFGNEEDEF
jgi:predicted histidine transporter YuiF (NhaC family)